mmetsp:Transcript_3319/g.8265  ORF Transcript_3319/g.8265 Transcript_3319/m.8265 type:complete len:105 (+) Transcript_3319:138-452(+)
MYVQSDKCRKCAPLQRVIQCTEPHAHVLLIPFHPLDTAAIGVVADSPPYSHMFNAPSTDGDTKAASSMARAEAGNEQTFVSSLLVALETDTTGSGSIAAEPPAI